MARLKLQLGRSRSGEGRGGKLLATVFFLFFFGIGSLFAVLMVRELIPGAQTYTWTERNCEIDAGEVVRRSGEEPYFPTVQYHTTDTGETYRGTGIERKPVSYGTHDKALSRLAPYPVGNQVTCYSSASGELVLEKGPVSFAAFIVLPLLFMFIGGGGLYATWRTRPRDSLGNEIPDALGDQANHKGGGKAAVGFGWASVAVGLLIGWFLVVEPISGMIASRHWTESVCTVDQSSVVSHRSDDGTTYSIDILYHWDRGQGIERSSRYSFFEGSSSGYDGKREVVGRYPAGADVPCFIDPQRANVAVLEPGLTLEAALALIPFFFLALGGALVIGGRRHNARAGRLRAQLERGEAPFEADDPVLDVLPAFEMATGPVDLRAESSRYTRLFGITFAAVFWNGIVSVFAREVWRDFERGRTDWGQILFLSPFVLIGLGLVVGIGYSILALRNPRPRLIASTATPRLGDRVELRWAFDGAVDRLDTLRIVFKGSESATYQVGTNSRTALEEFYEHVVVDAPKAVAALGGQVSFTVPAAAMHSFKSGHNEILWQIELTGEIPRWPDVKESYRLTVLPGPPKGDGLARSGKGRA